MRFHDTKIPGVMVIEGDVFADDRGSVMPAWIAAEFAAHGLAEAFVQWNIVRNHRRGTLRGMHYQRPPHGEAKLVRAIRGSIFDVAVDIRTGSPRYGEHLSAILSADNMRQFWVPAGYAHGFCTLEPDTEVIYKVTAYYSAAHDRGLAWDDPDLGIEWPAQAEAILSDKDRQHPRLKDLPPPFRMEEMTS